jgi:hypothetical protein
MPAPGYSPSSAAGPAAPPGYAASPDEYEVSGGAPTPQSVVREGSPLLQQAEAEELERYIDDLQAANRFKAFLIGTGVEVPADVIEGLAILTEHMAMP